jgi:hypothetical protein
VESIKFPLAIDWIMRRKGHGDFDQEVRREICKTGGA